MACDILWGRSSRSPLKDTTTDECVTLSTYLIPGMLSQAVAGKHRFSPVDDKTHTIWHVDNPVILHVSLYPGLGNDDGPGTVQHVLRLDGVLAVIDTPLGVTALLWSLLNGILM